MLTQEVFQEGWTRIKINIVSTVTFIDDVSFIVSIVGVITSNTSILIQSGGCWYFQ
jgi:hypothetical protein